MTTKIKVIVSVLIILIAGFIIMNQKNSTPSSVQANTQINETKSVTEIKQIIEQNAESPKFSIIDIRTPEEYSLGYIKGSTLMNFYDPGFSDALNSLDKTKTYVIYCNSGNRSGAALGLMKTKGFETVYNMQGGISAWESKGFEIV